MSEKKYAPVNQNLGAGIEFIRPSRLAEEGITGVVAEGIYEGTLPNQLEPSRKDFKIRKSDGTLLVLNSTSSLTRQMDLVDLNDGVQIVYNGLKTIKSGKAKGKSVHDFVVLKEVAE